MLIKLKQKNPFISIYQNILNEVEVQTACVKFHICYWKR